MTYRNLTNKEIELLEQRLCTCNNWQKLLVKEGFNPGNIFNSHFSGNIKIGKQEDTVELFGSVTKQSGIYNSALHNVEIGDNCYINNVKTYISNYSIGDNVIIDNIQILATEGKSSFGQGQKVAVLDESGGRQIMIVDNLSAQLAYIMTLYLSLIHI